MRISRRTTAVAVTAATAALLLTSCSGSSTSTGGDLTPEAIDSALEEGGTIEFWTWTPSGVEQAELFMEQYPQVTVEVVEAGGSSEQTTNLQNALAAGSGIPDVISVEYMNIPQLQLPGELLDLSAAGFGELESQFTASTWASVSSGDGIWALPQDSGPMAMFYNAEVFSALGIDIPTTWDEFVAAGEAITAADADNCIVADNGNGGFVSSMIWQAGGRPFAVDGETITIDLHDEGSQRWADSWNRIVEGGLNCDMSEWSDEWFASLSDGTIATVLTGAWMPGVFEASVPAAAGDWRVAPMPSYDGTPVNAENGGTGGAIPADSDNPALAAAFLRWLMTDAESIELFLSTGGFPSTVADLESEEFLGYESEYFGGQRINEVLVAGIEHVGEGWEYLPWQPYANNIAGETIGQSYVDRSDLSVGLEAWQQANLTYAEQQGFTTE
jgi:multiple sugar transport system substrate-binding protein